MIETRPPAQNLKEFEQGMRMADFWKQVGESLLRKFGVRLDEVMNELPTYKNPEAPNGAGGIFNLLDVCWALMGKNEQQEPDEYKDLMSALFTKRDEVLAGRTLELSEEEEQVIIDKVIAYEKKTGMIANFTGLTAEMGSEGHCEGYPGYRLAKRLEEGAWRHEQE